MTKQVIDSNEEEEYNVSSIYVESKYMMSGKDANSFNLFGHGLYENILYKWLVYPNF